MRVYFVLFAVLISFVVAWEVNGIHFGITIHSLKKARVSTNMLNEVILVIIAEPE